MSDRIAVMHAGRIAQLGSPEGIYRAPANRFVAGFIGESNLYHARRTGPQTAVIQGGVAVTLPGPACADAQEIGLMLRPERVRRLRDGETADLVFDGTIEEVVYLGETVKYRIRTAGDGPPVLARWQLPAAGDVPARGDAVRVGWERADLHCFPWT